MLNYLKIILLSALCMSFIFSAEAQDKSYEAVRIPEAPKIDGVLDDVAWQNANIATDFIQFEPNPNTPASKNTEVRLVYDDIAIYISAYMYDNDPERILKNLGQRDDLGVNADYFSVTLDTFDDDENAFGFFVTSAGVQADVKMSNRNEEDENWDAVWESAAKIVADGWVAEIKIPYSAIRFPEQAEQTWGLNFWRSIRGIRERSTWDYFDTTEDGVVNQSGVLTGLKDISPPTRLSFTPFVAGTMDKSTNITADFGYNTGMDVKYGLNESFTLDLTLIPDFGEVKSDEQILNLSPFEQRFDENRAFFTEGTELFSKQNLFYSRRIGQKARGFVNLKNEISSNEIITRNPIEAKLLNAAKLSGRTGNGWGIGVFNAFTQKTSATAVNTVTNESREIVTSPFTNFNILSVEKTLPKNSSVSLINTNVLRANKGRNANVTGLGLRLGNERNSHALSGRINVSQVFNYNDNESKYNSKRGFNSFVEYGKISGKFNWELWSSIESDKYDRNDLGILFNNNEMNHGVRVRYFENDSGEWYQNYGISLRAFQQNLYKPFKNVDHRININPHVTFKDYTTMWAFFRVIPDGTRDYYEPRQRDFETYYERPPRYMGRLGVSSDYRKQFAVDVAGGHQFSDNKHHLFEEYFFEFEPRFTFSDKFSAKGELEFYHFPTDYGYVETNSGGDVIMGKRDRKITGSELVLEYIFNENTNLWVEGRYTWDKGIYKGYYILENDGSLNPTANFPDKDPFNFSAFNLDAVFSWRFAAGSDLNLIYKNAFSEYTTDVRTGLPNNIVESFKAPKSNQLAIKLLYYLDYSQIKNLFKNNNNNN